MGRLQLFKGAAAGRAVSRLQATPVPDFWTLLWRYLGRIVAWVLYFMSVMSGLCGICGRIF